MTLLSKLTPVGPILAGATLASASTITPTAAFHQISGTTAIGNIATPTRGAGSTVELLFQSSLTVQNNGGGSGNIRTLSGSDRVVQPNEILMFIYDGTVWREAGATPESYGTAFPASGLYNGRRFTLYVTEPTNGGSLGWEFMYRSDLDASYPWAFCGGKPFQIEGSASVHTTSQFGTIANVISQFSTPRAGTYDYAVVGYGTSNGSNPVNRLVLNGTPQSWVNSSYQQSGRLSGVAAGYGFYVQHSNDFGNINLSDTSTAIFVTFAPVRLA